MWIALNLQFTFSRTAVFTILMLPVHEHEWSLHLPSISLAYVPVTFLVRFIPGLFVDCCECDSSHGFFPMAVFGVEEGYWSWHANVVTCHLASHVGQF